MTTNETIDSAGDFEDDEDDEQVEPTQTSVVVTTDSQRDDKEPSAVVNGDL